jgi:aryl-alcohol dehydrogenase-like predicted oxidoreductase
MPMKKKTPQPKGLGIPKGIPAHLRKALADELQKMGTTYPDLIQGMDPPPTPEVVLKLASTWNSLTPAQKAAWDNYAAQENQRFSGGGWDN